MLIRLSVDEVMWCRQQSVNHQGQELLCNLHCATTVVLREQLNFKSAVIRSERSACSSIKEEELFMYWAYVNISCGLG